MRLDDQVTIVGFTQPSDDLHQGALTLTVSTYQTDPLAALEHKARLVEHSAQAEVHTQPVTLNHTPTRRSRCISAQRMSTQGVALDTTAAARA